jgi:DNA-binding MarR family transcriptional regulator
MDHQPKASLPIGYWLKRVDNLLNEQIDKLHVDSKITRSDWQVLNLLSEMGSGSKQQIFESMQTFVDPAQLEKILSGLVERGWIGESVASERAIPAFQLTEEGKRQHQQLLARQKEVRQRAVQGISEEEYVTVIQVLQRMASNLEDE